MSFIHALLAKLTNTPHKRYVDIGESTRTVIMEKIVCNCSR